MQDEKCAHPECECDATPDHHPYCSEFCAASDADETPRTQGCLCGHEACG